MRSDRLLNVLILSELVLATLGAVSAWALEPLLPQALRGYVARPPGTIVEGLWWAVAAGTIVSWVGLASRIREARSLYLASWVGYLVLVLARGPVVAMAWTEVSQMGMAAVGGGILVLVHFSDLAPAFRPLSERPGDPGARAA